MGDVIHTKKWIEKQNMSSVSLTGTVIPWSRGPISEYKLVCSSGLEYLLVTDSKWKEVLSCYRWEDIKLVGLLNVSNMTIIPQKVLPTGRQGEKDSGLQLGVTRGRVFMSKIVENLCDFVFIPAAICAVMS